MADLEKIANGVTSTVVSRGTIVIMPFLMVIIGYFVTGKLDDIKQTQSRFWTATSEIVKTLNDVKTNIATSNEAFIAHKTADELFEQIVKASQADHESRLRLIEQTKGK